jgi:16S rRNA (guanine527-N7)-methyltransferase
VEPQLFHVNRPPDPGTGVSRETRERLEAFAALLRAWNHRVNLVARGDLDSLWPRHIADSLQLAPWIDGRLRDAADIGSGGGFPGLVLAIASGCHFHLIESDHRKAAFLREAARVTGASVTVHAVRAETLGGLAVPLVTARAVAPLTELLRLAVPLLEPGQDSTCLFLKGRSAEAELTQARARWQMRVEMTVSRTDANGRVLRIDGIRGVETTA